MLCAFFFFVRWSERERLFSSVFSALRSSVGLLSALTGTSREGRLGLALRIRLYLPAVVAVVASGFP